MVRKPMVGSGVKITGGTVSTGGGDIVGGDKVQFISGKNIATDRTGALAMFTACKDNLTRVITVLVDGAYTGAPFAASVLSTIGASVEIAKRNELHTFAVIPKRWVVERSFACLEKCRRFGKTTNVNSIPVSIWLFLPSWPFC